ncbi:hypothetical protein HNR46_002040 [Haloferula luteola]|uniref:Carbohydrate-binding domain-containing protein n=1 Tax=Haloferula luteola TaxID=595692 RepID=A0A840VG84_9BACT|nr:carbohydrate-binding domain-containing protein [Haloferula luteola]MBB5351801.1 hypothetical protein [Haloferula luteola]
MKTPLPPLLCLLTTTVIQAADRDFPEISDFPRTVTITLDGTSATIEDPVGITIDEGATASELSITSEVEGVRFILRGNSENGFVEITSPYRVMVTLDGLDLTSSDGPALSVFTEKRTFIDAVTGTTNHLSDTAEYTRSGSGTLFSGGSMIFSGEGQLEVESQVAHAIYATKSVRVLRGDLLVPSAAKDAIHPKSRFDMDGGHVSLAATGDGIDADKGITIAGGRLDVSGTSDDTKGLASGDTLEITGGLVSIDFSGDQSKAIAADADITFLGGTILLDLSGDVVLETVEEETLSYVDPAYCTGIKSDSNFVMQGGNLSITHRGLAGKAISVDGDVSISAGTLDLATLSGSSSRYTNSEGETDTASPDGIKADGAITITGGIFALRADGSGADAISADLALTIEGGTFDIRSRGDQSKGLKSKTAIDLAGGVFDFNLSGDVALESVATGRYDPSYCTAIKSSGDLTVEGGTVSILHQGVAGKGVSIDGNIVMSGGTFDITTTGDASATFTNASGVTDWAGADAFKADGTLTVTGGTLNTLASGSGGDAISCDGDALIGILGIDDTPVITASTTGSRVTVSGSDYMNTKAFKAAGNFTMNGGTYTGSTTSNGAEGLESKATLTINGGTIAIQAYDDGINATTNITINGGAIYSYASNNDGIDSNGTLRITGGLIVSSGANSPEEGFDCDQNNFTITGGILVGSGGATSTPTSSTSTQRSVIYKGSGTADVILRVTSSSGDHLVYKIPRTYSGGGGGGGGFPGGGGSSSTAMTLLFSNPDLASGTTYSIISGATVSGGTEFHGLYTDATVSGGTTLKTFNPTSMVTTVQ